MNDLIIKKISSDHEILVLILLPRLSRKKVILNIIAKIVKEMKAVVGSMKKKDKKISVIKIILQT